MNKNDLTEYTDLLLQAAVCKCDDLADAQDLVQDTLLIALTAIVNGKEIAKPKGWLMTVLNRRYYDMLRQKYRKPTVCIDVALKYCYERPDSFTIFLQSFMVSHHMRLVYRV